MADRLYLSLWYPNFRLESLPDALAGVLRQFAQVGAKRVSAASAYPINFTEPPTYQRIYADPVPAHFDPTVPIDPSADTFDELIDAAVAEATEQLHDDMAYEFEMRWQLWTPEDQEPAFSRLGFASSRDEDDADPDLDALSPGPPGSAWRLRAHTVRILGFGPASTSPDTSRTATCWSTSASTPPGSPTPRSPHPRCNPRKTRPSTRPRRSTSSRTSKSSSPSPSWWRRTAASPAASSGPSPASPSPKNSSPASSASTDFYHQRGIEKLDLARYGISMTDAEARLGMQLARSLPIAVVCGAVVLQRWQKRRLDTLAQGWPSVDGWIQYGEVEPVQNTNLILATLTYSYFIEEYRSGTYTHQFSKKSDADEFVSQLKDKHVPIRYNPSKPDESDIEESDINQFVSSLSRIG